jgi:hypothetical protein
MLEGMQIRLKGPSRSIVPVFVTMRNNGIEIRL